MGDPSCEDTISKGYGCKESQGLCLYPFKENCPLFLYKVLVHRIIQRFDKLNTNKKSNSIQKWMEMSITIQSIKEGLQDKAKYNKKFLKELFELKDPPTNDLSEEDPFPPKCFGDYFMITDPEKKYQCANKCQFKTNCSLLTNQSKK